MTKFQDNKLLIQRQGQYAHTWYKLRKLKQQTYAD